MMKVKGTTVYPAAVQRALDGVEQVIDYVMIVTSPSALSDELTIVAAVKDVEPSARALIAERLQAELKVTPLVRIADLAEIEQLQGLHTLRKKRVFIDQRQDIGRDAQ